MRTVRQIRSKVDIESEIHRRAVELALAAGDSGRDIPMPSIVGLEYDGPVGSLWDLSFVDFNGAAYVEAAAREISARWDLFPSASRFRLAPDSH